MKKILMMIVAPLIVVAVIGVSIFDQIHYAQHKGYTVNCAHQGPPSAASESLVCIADNHQEYDAGKPYPPPWNVFLAWPEGITALLLAFTLAGISWQAWETRKSADAAMAQMRRATSRDRAVIKVQPQGMTVVDNLNRDYWFLANKIGLRNVGISRAYILNGSATLKLRFDREKPKFKDSSKENLKIVDGFIPANTPPDSPLLEEVFYMVQALSVAEQADHIFPGKVVPYISGFVEYETVGTIFRRNFHYSWRSRGRKGVEGFQAYRLLTSLYPNTPPSDKERICAGEWFKEAEGNEEYEVESQSPPGFWAKTKAFLEELGKEGIEESQNSN